MSEKVWFVSDHHFDHFNIIRYTGRPFKTVGEMNKRMMDEHNRTVSNGDIVYILGDFCFGGKQRWQELTRQMAGRLRLVLGNHDRGRSIQWYYEAGFERVYDKPIIWGDWHILSHRPVGFMSPDMPYLNIHGHTHQECYAGAQRINVSVDVTGFKPIDLNMIQVRSQAKYEQSEE